MRRVLILANDYYPNAGVSAHRIAKFAKYLPECGWRPLVVCVGATPQNTTVYDASLLTENVKQTILHAMPEKRRCRNRLAQALVDLDFACRHPRIAGTWIGSRLLRRYAYRFPANYYCRALAFGRQYLAHHHVDCILATFPHASALAVADQLSRKCRIPWVADFRDTYDIRLLMKNERRRQCLLAEETNLLASCAAIITVSNALRDCLRKRNQQTVYVIPNGFDPDDFASAPVNPPAKFTILYTGTVWYPERDPTPLFTAVENLLATQKIDARLFSIEFYGKSHDTINRLLNDHPALKEIVEAFPPISYANSIEKQKSAHVLFHLAIPGEKGVMTAKLFEYLAANRPVLCSPGDHDCVDEILRQTGAGVSGRTSDEIADLIKTWYDEWLATGQLTYAGRNSEIYKYTRKSQTAALAEILNAAINNPAVRGQE